MTCEERLYRENVGRDPVTRFPDDPDWRYRGTKAERDELLEKIEEPPPDQESLFEDNGCDVDPITDWGHRPPNGVSIECPQQGGH